MSEKAGLLTVKVSDLPGQYPATWLSKPTRDLPGIYRVGDSHLGSCPPELWAEPVWWVTWSDLPGSYRVGKSSTLQACITRHRPIHA